MALTKKENDIKKAKHLQLTEMLGAPYVMGHNCFVGWRVLSSLIKQHEQYCTGRVN